MAEVGWRKVYTVKRYVAVTNIEAMSSQSTPQIGVTAYSRPQKSITI